MDRYTCIIVGSGFAGSFFLKKRLERAAPSDRFLVLERGPMVTHAEQVAMRTQSTVDHAETFRQTGEKDKDWRFNVGFGGGSNCWWAGTPRMLPNDFKMQSSYGVARDWPISYDDLADYYSEAERIMNIAGSADGPFPNRPPYPQPAHRLTAPDRLLKAAYPDTFFNQPTARASVAGGGRGQCCANGVCQLCPVNAKFTILNGMSDVYADPRVTLLTDAEVLNVDVAGGLATGVRYTQNSETKTAQAESVALGANAIFNPFLLLASGLNDAAVGTRLHEQGSLNAFVYLDGVDNFQGSTSVTGHGYMLYDGDHRRDGGAALIETWNVPRFRKTPGKWRQLLELYIIIEDLPEAQNTVSLDQAAPDRPVVHFEGHSDYLYRGVEHLKKNLETVLSKALPIEKIEYSPLRNGEAHIQGTTAMGDDPSVSVVDRNLVHHKVRNLFVLGNSTFPTGPPANPTLTLSALSLRAAEAA